MYRVGMVKCRSALNKSGIGGVDYVINPFVGCSHACVYCYADFMRRFVGHEGSAWGSFVDVKANLLECLRRQVLRGTGRPIAGHIMLSSVTDPYQPLEADWGLTRGSLAILLEVAAVWRDGIFRGADPPSPGFSVSILTKSDLVTRDIDLLRELPNCRVGFTITTPSCQVARLFEPGAPPPSRRLLALERLSRAGISTWVFMGPVLPYFSDRPEEMDRLFKAIGEAGAGEVVVDRMNFYPSVRHRVTRLMARLETNHPGALNYLRRILADGDAWERELKTVAGEVAGGRRIRVRFAF